MPILRWIALWKHLFYLLNLNGILSNFLRFRCLSFKCPSLGRWLTPCVEKPALTVSHTLNLGSEYFTLSHAYVVYVFSQIGGLSQQVLSDVIIFSISLLMSIVKCVALRTLTEGCFASFPWVFCTQGWGLHRIWYLSLMSLMLMEKKCNMPFTLNSCTPMLLLFVGSGKEIASHVTWSNRERQRACAW